MRTPSNALPPLPLEGVRIADATVAAEILENQGLDGRDLNSAGNGLRRANPLHIVPVFLRTLLFLTFLPFSVTSLGFQVALGRLLGDSTDEGQDARTSYQFLAAFFGSLLVWPLIAALWLGAAFMFHESLTLLLANRVCFVLLQRAWHTLPFSRYFGSVAKHSRGRGMITSTLVKHGDDDG